MKKQECSYILLQGVFLISMLFFILLISSILFMFKLSISYWNLLLATVFSVCVTFFFSGKSFKKTAITIVIGLLILTISIFICMHIYDWSWDGNAYRKARTGLLKYGWNPIYETYFDFSAKNVPDVNIVPNGAVGIWFDTSPKASEIIAANFYQITNNIEAGKCYTMLAAIALFCICYAFLKQSAILKKWQCICCSTFAVLNPLTVAQAATNYNDAFLNLMLLLCLVSLLYLTFYEKKAYNLMSWYFIFVSINIGFNLKLSMPLFLAILCISIFLYWFVTAVKKDGIHKAVLYYRKHFCFFAISVVSGIFITGSTHYVSNFMHYGHPFGMSSAGGTAEEVTNQLPTVYKNMSHLQRFVCSLFSKTNGSQTLEKVEWKIPLTFDAQEFSAAQSFAVRTAGWGIFFSGIFLISIAVILYSLIKFNKTYTKLKHITMLWFVVSFLSVCFIPGLSWSKYNQAIFWIPVAALIYAFLGWNDQKNRSQGAAFASGIIMILLCLNMVPNFAKDYQLLKDYNATRDQLEQFKKITEDEYNKVIVDIPSGTAFLGRFFNLYDMGITKISRGDVKAADRTGTLFNNWGVLYYKVINELSIIDNAVDFLDCLADIKENYTILIAVKDEASTALTDDIVENMRNLGLEFNLPGHFRWSYLAIVDEGEVVYEYMEDEQTEYKTNLSGSVVSLVSAGYVQGHTVSIKIDGAEYSLNKRGLNIVVYDKESGIVIDSICIDSYKDNSLSR